MHRTIALSAALLLGMVAHASGVAKGTHIKQASLVTRTGATVATTTPDPSGRCVFRNVPEGEYKVVLTNSEGRSVTIGDLDGDGVPDLIVQGGSTALVGSGGGAGKASMSDLSVTRQTQGATFGEKVNAGMHAAGSSLAQGASVASPRDSASGQATGKRTVAGGSLPGGAVVSAAVSPRDAASGLPTGKRQHKPISCVVGWDGTVKGFASESAARGATSATAPASGGLGVKVHCPAPGTVEVLSWSWGMSNPTSMSTGGAGKG